jgi:hypothetical protein
MHRLENVVGLFSWANCPHTGAYSLVQACANEALLSATAISAKAHLDRVVKVKEDRMFEQVNQSCRVYEGPVNFYEMGHLSCKRMQIKRHPSKALWRGFGLGAALLHALHPL